MPKTTAKIKSVKSRKTTRITRPQVISFRITAAQAKTLTEIYKRELATNVNSPNQLCRKWVVDYLAGRLEYADKTDKDQDLDTVTC